MFGLNLKPKLIFRPTKGSSILLSVGVFFLIIHYIFTAKTLIPGWVLVILGFILNIVSRKKIKNTKKEISSKYKK